MKKVRRQRLWRRLRGSTSRAYRLVLKMEWPKVPSKTREARNAGAPTGCPQKNSPKITLKLTIFVQVFQA